jgi:hypothetical protein
MVDTSYGRGATLITSRWTRTQLSPMRSWTPSLLGDRPNSATGQFELPPERAGLKVEFFQL